MIYVLILLAGAFIAILLIEDRRTMRVLKKMKKNVDAMNEQTQRAIDECRKLSILLILPLLIGCGSAKITSNERSEAAVVREHFRELTKIDSVMVYQRDSVYIRERSDTVFVDRFHTLVSYRDRLRVDTLRATDTVRITLTERVSVAVEVNRLTGWQWFQVWCGRIFVAAAVLIGVYLALKWKLKF
jgi:hypothetical protein